MIWVQGCPLRCPGCVAPETLPFTGGEAVRVVNLADRILGSHQIDGVTFSGGEPFAQAGALCQLVDALRRERDLSVMCYSGYTLEWLRRKGTGEQLRLLDRLDILIDGPYRREMHAALRWRGSSNQRIHLLSSRHLDLAEQPDASVGLEVSVDPEGLSWAGVPPTPGFRGALEQRLLDLGIGMRVSQGGSK